MNRISMSMVMGLAQNDTKKKTRPTRVKKLGEMKLREKKLREMRQGRRLSLIENVDYNVLWARQNSEHLQNGRGAGKEAQAQNFSDGGVALVTTEALKPSEVVQLNLSFSHFGVTVPTIAEVVWADRRSVNGLYRVGLRYIL